MDTRLLQRGNENSTTRVLMLILGAPRWIDKLITITLILELQTEYTKVKTAVEETQITRVIIGCERSKQTITYSSQYTARRSINLVIATGNGRGSGLAAAALT